MDKIKAKYMISQISPKLLSLLLENIRVNKEYSRADIVARLAEIGKLQVRDPILLNELVDILTQFELLDGASNKSFTLNKKGNDLKSIYLRNKSLFFEIYHLMMFYAFELQNNQLDCLPFKSYQTLCRLLFNENQKSNKQLADEIDKIISVDYNVIGSFSDACVTRGLLWLYEFKPAISPEDTRGIFKREDVVPPIFLFNLFQYYKRKSISLKDPLFVDSETKRELCIPVFLKEDSFLNSLDDTCDKYPNHIEKKYNISGTYIVLKSEINYSDLK